MQASRPSPTRLANNLYRCTQTYMNEVLSKYQLSSGTYPYLLTFFGDEGVNQNQISKELNIDKSMSARSIQKLIGLGYLTKEDDDEDSRAYKLFLTDKAKQIIPSFKKELRQWNEMITKDLNEEERGNSNVIGAGSGKC